MKRLAILAITLIAIAGCDEKQRRQIDQIAMDVNQWTDVGRQVLESPAGRTIPPPIGLIAASVIAVASGAVNGWQKYRGNQMKKTTKAIVRGIEKAEKEVEGNPISLVKQSIAKEMRTARIFDQGNKIVDTLKIGG